MRIFLAALCAVFSLACCGVETQLANAQHLENDTLRFSISADTGAYEILDKQTEVLWRSNPAEPRFGEIVFSKDGRNARAALGKCELKAALQQITATFHPLADKADEFVRVSIRIADRAGLTFAYEKSDGLALQNIRLLDAALWITDTDNGYAAVPAREGLMIPVDSGLVFSRRFGTNEYEGCNMCMFGLVKNGATVLINWESPYVVAELKSITDANASPLNKAGLRGVKQIILPSIELQKSAKSFHIQFCGKGDYVTIAQAYRKIGMARGWYVPWDEKLKKHPDGAKYFGAANIKLWSLLSRRMNEDSTKEENVKVSWTFDEAAQVAEHFKNDVKIDKVLLTLGGWIKRGYDNQHPDILPAAPECGGDAAFADCSKRILSLGYLYCLHDNYQDIYRDSPSWDEKWLQKRADGKPAVGGHWAGGRAYLTCSKMALELAQRPQNLSAVKKLTNANSYFIDTTYAAGLQECYDPNHPLTREDDRKYKQLLSDYARDVFGTFGSECGREWAVPHADFFEGLAGVSGGYYHDAKLLPSVGGAVIPLFELVYRDCIQAYGKYGYDPAHSAEYVLHHIAIGRCLNYHNVPAHLYWKDGVKREEPVGVKPLPPEVEITGKREFKITYHWQVLKNPGADWRIFVHFTDKNDAIKFQNDYQPPLAVSKWEPGELKHGPFTVKVPDGLSGDFQVRLGMYDQASQGRVRMMAVQDGQRRVTLGQITVGADKLLFTPANPDALAAQQDRSTFTHANNGWAEDMHPYDAFVKNTYEVLSPLNELTSRMPMTRHEFLTPGRRVQHSVFGEGAAAVETIVNMSNGEFRCTSKLGGEVILPPFGFLVEGESFVAFHAAGFNGVKYEAPVLFTLRSLEGPLASSTKVRVFHGFGDAQIKFGKSVRIVLKEEIVSAKD